MKKILLLLFPIAITACTNEIDNIADEYVNDISDKESVRSTKSLDITPLSSWETRVFSGTPDQQKYKNQKVILNSRVIKGSTGIYLCDVVKVTTKITVTNSDDEIIRAVTNDDRCGYIASTVSTSTPVRGTEVVQDPNNPSIYRVSTTCYRIIASTSGIMYPSNYWIPCNPNNVKLVYKYRHVE